MTNPSAPPQGRRTGGAIALIAIGLLILVPSGLCTALVGIYDAVGFNWLVFLIGGPPMALGALLLFLGLSWRRSP
jgi:hypothetical protein